MKTKFRYILSLIFIVSATITNAQQYSLDSLYEVLQTNIHDTTRINTWNAISWELKFQNTDSALYYANNAKELSEKIKYPKGTSVSKRTIATIYYLQGKANEAVLILEEALDIATGINNKYQMAKCYNLLGSIYENLNSPDNVISNLEKALQLFIEIDNKIEIAGVSGNIAQYYSKLGSYTIALDYLFTVLANEEELNNKVGIARTYNMLASTYSSLGEKEKAIEYFKKAIPILIELNYITWLSSSYHNLASAYSNIDSTDQALDYFNKALKINIQMKDSMWISFNYGGMSMLYLELEDIDNAFKYAFLAKNIMDSLGITNPMTYSMIGNIYFANEQYLFALEYFNQSLELELINNEISKIRQIYFYLYKTYKKLNNPQKSLEALENYTIYSDSLVLENDLREIGKFEANYSYEKIKQQQDFEQQQKDLQVEEQMKRQKIFTIFVIIGLILTLLLAIFMIIAFKTKQKANILLQKKNDKISQQKGEIEQQNEEITTQNEELNQKNEEILAQKEEIELQRDLANEQNEKIISSINYAHLIQKAILPTNQVISELLPEHFILFKPRDIVSGDFYWIKQIKNQTIVAVADCTGHGVPGAFVSMLGITLLNEIVRNDNITKASQILDELRTKIKISLNQNDITDGNNDGMDISLFTIDFETKKMQFAGANNPLFVIRKNKLITFKPNRQPVSIYIYEKPFTNHEFVLEKGDLLYSFSDGYPDQFGGENNQKFYIKRFKNLLLSIKNKSMSEQTQILDKTFEEWRGNIEQIDDVVVFGLRL